MAGGTKLVAAFTLALASAPLTDVTLRPEVDKLVAAVGAARHLPFHGALPAHALGADEIRRATALAVGEGLDSAAARTEDQLLKRLGLIPAGHVGGDLAAAAYALAAPPAARYDAATGTLLVPSSLPLGSQRAELVHEIAHAVADQRFGLRRFLRLAPERGPRLDGDATRARLALVEGDAVLAGFELLDPRENFLGAHALHALAAQLRGASRTSTEDPSENPSRDLPQETTLSWFARLGQFTHVDGLLFVARVRAHHPFAAVDALWGDPPASSEQVLHPEKYDACEPTITVDEGALPSLTGFGRPAASDVLGELVVRTWLESALPADVAARAAAGWGGDRAGLYAPTPQTSGSDGGTATPMASIAPLAWLTVWDDAAEADDFARAARQVLAQMSKETDKPSGDSQITTAAAPTDESELFATSRGTYALARKGDAVALLLAAPEPVAPALAAMLEAAHPRANRRGVPRPRRAAQPDCPRRDRAAGSG
ncbi:MAG TPA: hypothetical protein VLT58_05775 [Polyangia bacterium]|nr:hypothetical protein [Polyangia bacterium]